MFFIVLSCLLCHIHSKDWLSLHANNLMGTVLSEVGLMSNLCESSVVWLLVGMIVLSCVFHCTLMLACHIHSTAELGVSSNRLMGMIPNELALMSNLCESSVVLSLVVMIVMCFSLYSHACLSFFILQIGCLSTTIISLANSRVLPLLIIVTFPALMRLKLAISFKETSMH